MFMLQVLMLLIGLYALIRGDIPTWFLGGKGYEIKGWPARGLGLLMMSTVPLAILVMAFLAFFDVPNFENVGYIIELIIVILVAIATVVLSRRLRQPVEEEDIATEVNLPD
jgi:chromate transport protein ChrA